MAEWGVALAHAHVGRLDQAATHVKTMGELETSLSTSEHRVLGDVVAALRSDAAGDRDTARTTLTAVPWDSTAAEQMYPHWAPLAKLW